MDTATKVYGGLGGIVAVFTIIGGLWLTSQTFATDIEVLAATEVVKTMHQQDKVTAAEARKNERIDAVSRDIRKLKREIEFGPESEKAYNESELTELRTLKQNIIDGKR